MWWQRERQPDLWTGSLPLSLLNIGATPAQVVVERDQVMVRLADRLVATLARDDLRTWLQMPTGPIVTADAVIAADGMDVTLAVDLTPAEQVPRDLVALLRAIV